MKWYEKIHFVEWQDKDVGFKISGIAVEIK